jgi:hypothetical protein
MMKTQDKLAEDAYEMWRAEFAPGLLPCYEETHELTQNHWISRVGFYMELPWDGFKKESDADRCVRLVCSNDK